MELEQTIKKMLVEDPFYGFMLTTLERTFTDQVETLGVGFNSNMNAELYVNKEYFDSLTDVEQMAVLKHELMHLAFHHLTMADTFPDRNRFNYAADMEVNSYIAGLPNGVLYSSQIGLDGKLGTMTYYRALPPQQNAQGAGGTGGNMPGPNVLGKILDDHSTWKQCGNHEEREVMNSMIDDILVRTARSVKDRGCIPSELIEKIELLEKPFKQVYDWKKAFRRFLGNSYSERKKSSRRKESRRFPGAAGSKHLKKSNILVAIDTSGSVSDKELQELFSELTYMHKAGSNIHIIECDAQIQKEYDYKPGRVVEVSGRGGTDFNPVIRYYKEHYSQYETLVYFTDGYAPLNFTVPQNNMMWLISSQGKHDNYPGKTIYIPKQND